MGNVWIINPATNGHWAYNSVAIADFSDVDITFAPGNSQPNWTNANGGLAWINAMLTKNRIFSIYDLVQANDARTNFIVTFPTKLFSTALFPTLFDTNPVAPTTKTAAIGLQVYDDAEGPLQTTSAARYHRVLPFPALASPMRLMS